MWYYYDAQNHNSVLGIREYAYRFGSGFRVLNEEDLPHDESCTRTCERDEKNMFGVIDHNYTYSLFAYPAEDNFAGVKYPLSWIKQVQDGYFHDVCIITPLPLRETSGWFFLTLPHSFPRTASTCRR